MNNINRIKRFGLLFLLGTLSCYVSFTQENYIPGYIIKHNKDTIYGLIDYRNWEKNPNSVEFKTGIENKSTSFKPTDITEFGVQDEIYLSGIIKTEVTKLKIDELENDPQLKLKVDTTFLQTLIRGKKELYYYKNKDGRENFYIKQGSAFELLVYKKYLKLQDGNNIIAENKQYQGQLGLYLNDCSTLHSRLKNTSYKENSLYSLFQYYNQCSPSDISFQKKPKNISTEIGVLAGTSLTSLKFSGINFEYLINADYNSSINLASGLFFDLVLPRNQGKWSIYNELLFSTYNVTGRYEDYENENQYSTTTTEIGYSYLKINNFVRFKYPVGPLFLYINGGMSNGFAISEKNYKKIESKFYSTEKVVEESALNETRKYEQGFILGTGVKFKNYCFEIRAETGNGMSVYNALNSKTKRYYFLLGYRFK